MPRPKKEACMPEDKLREIEDDIRDLINWVRVWNQERKIDDAEAEQIIEKLRATAEKLGIYTL